MPKGVRDLVIDGEDVDVKNTVGVTWMIPRETYNVGGPCLLICIADASGRCWLGLILAREAYLSAPNQDKKRGVSAFGRKNILWLAEGVPFASAASYSRYFGIKPTTCEFINPRAISC